MAKRAHRENRHGREEESSGRKRRNPLKAAGVETVDYKNVGLLRTFLSDRGKIRSRRVLARRLSGGKVPAALDGLAEEVVALLTAEQEAMLGDARAQRRAHCRRRLGRGCRGRGDGRLGADQLGAPGGRRRDDPRAVGGHGPLPPTSGRLTAGERGRTGSDRRRGTFVLTIGPRRPKASSRRARYSSSKRRRKAMVY